ncbi:Hypothetical protein [Arabidopsis thaliana]|uniref:T28P6.11 protein n=2 Tax=Arabidopsis thaliana TaxID=3702 RepID=Q9SXA9_ARATH|nr:transmembrane protein, putative (DUF761) [Arabidopsis thaliana]AAD50005.1 Hypothetical protein [Arabidopsis thaliana]ABE65613.1 hypothetical protein At1g11230 [Arabidopsis thaliana]AEE28702.1 transmembrane protein, putative (DUF761) [Arabidopsis thaliana]|eukprot:NP_001184961.1 transmembrane protein, putative (DUF761) [Arabidopsis thaliana]
MVCSTIIKAVLISTGIITAMSMFLKVFLPVTLYFSLSFSTLWSSFLPWLKPPYLFVFVNVMITIIIASSRYYRSIGDHDGKDEKNLHGRGYYRIQTEPIVNQTSPPRLEVKDMDLDVDFDFMATIQPPEVERSEVVYEEKEEEISELINGGDEFVVLEESENLPPVEKPLVSARFEHRKMVKVTPKGTITSKCLRKKVTSFKTTDRFLFEFWNTIYVTSEGDYYFAGDDIRKKALKVVNPKRDNKWKTISEEGTSRPLSTSHYQRPDIFGLGAGGDSLRKSETFRDVTNYYHQSSLTVTPPVKMEKEMLPSLEDLNRRIEAFIKKVKEERLESLRLDKEVA